MPITEAGRKKIADAQKKRWRAYFKTPEGQAKISAKKEEEKRLKAWRKSHGR